MGGKTRLQYRADLRLDLKDSGALWSDAELNRCTEKAVSDLSRFLPREKTYEESLQFTVADEEVEMPEDTSLDGVVADADLNTADDGSAIGVDGQPDVPRHLTATITDANNSVTGLTVTMYGTDENELAVKETLHWHRGDSKTIPGKKYFKNVYMVYVDQIDGAGDGDILDIGYGVYTDVWVSLANKPIKWGSETSVTDVDGNALTRNTDFYIDYAKGRIKAISGGGIIAGDTVTISYTKSQLDVDLSGLADLIRVERVEYPVGDIPQSFVQHDKWGDILSITGGSEQEEQSSMAEDKHIRVYYAAEHQQPNEFSPGSVPEFLENTIILAAGAYALFEYSLKQTHQAETDMGTARTALLAAGTAHTALGTALTNIKKYLDNNAGIDAATILYHVETDVANLRTALFASLNAAQSFLVAVATGDLANADSVVALYLGSTDATNFISGATEPSIKAYLAAGDAFLNTVAVGGEETSVPIAYAQYAQITRTALVSAYEEHRRMYLANATARTNAALGYTQEAAQRLSLIRSYIEQSTGYATIANTFAREAEARLTEINGYLNQANGYAGTASGHLIMADRYRTEAIERRNEAYSIWRDRKQYIGDYTQSSMRQMPTYNRG